MKLREQNEKLKAYLNDELSEEDAAVFDRELAADPELRAALEEARLEYEDFGEAHEDEESDQALKIWVWPIAAAVLVAIVFMVVKFFVHPQGDDAPIKISPNLEDFTVSHMSEANASIIKIPLSTGSGSLPLITKSIREDRKLPANYDVRIEELLNAFQLDVNSSVALWKGCALGMEILPCPWSPSENLVFVKVRSARQRESQISVEYRADKQSIIRSELIGYSPGGIQKQPRQNTENMPLGSESLIGILVSSKSPNLGSLAWEVDGEPAPLIKLLRNEQMDVSADARFATLICSFGFWLRGELSEIIDDAMILGLAREVAADSLVPKRYDFLDLIDQAVKIKAQNR